MYCTGTGAPTSGTGMHQPETGGLPSGTGYPISGTGSPVSGTGLLCGDDVDLVGPSFLQISPKTAIHAKITDSGSETKRLDSGEIGLLF